MIDGSTRWYWWARRSRNLQMSVHGTSGICSRRAFGSAFTASPITSSRYEMASKKRSESSVSTDSSSLISAETMRWIASSMSSIRSFVDRLTGAPRRGGPWRPQAATGPPRRQHPPSLQPFGRFRQRGERAEAIRASALESRRECPDRIADAPDPWRLSRTPSDSSHRLRSRGAGFPFDARGPYVQWALKAACTSILGSRFRPLGRERREFAAACSPSDSPNLAHNARSWLALFQLHLRPGPASAQLSGAPCGSGIRRPLP